MEFKGTKGEWYIDTELNYINEHGAQVRVISSDSVENMIDIFGNQEEDLANAQLIASAPELLEFLIELYNDKETHSSMFPSQQKKLKELIEKATKID
jgi:hypothetical protein